MNNSGLAAESAAQVSNNSDIRQFDWTEPLESALSEFDCERYNQQPLPQQDLFELQKDEFTSNTERKRDLQTMCQGAPLRRKKKPKSLPKRPLSAYNLYFQRLRADLYSDGGSKVGFHELGKIVGRKWKSLSVEEHEIYRELAIRDSERYRRDMEQHKKLESLKKEEKINSERSPWQEESIEPDQSAAILPSRDNIPVHQNYARTLSPSYGNSSQFPPRDYPLNPPPPRARTPLTWGNDFSAPSHVCRAVYPGYVAVQPPVLMGGIPTNGKPLPPGSEVHVRDEAGKLRSYTVQYAMVTMTRDEAKEYMDKLK